MNLETAVGSTDYSDSTDWKRVGRSCRFTPRVIWKQRRGEASSPGTSVKSVKSVDSPTAAFRMKVSILVERSPRRCAAIPSQVPAYPCHPCHPWFQLPFPGSPDGDCSACRPSVLSPREPVPAFNRMHSAETALSQPHPQRPLRLCGRKPFIPPSPNPSPNFPTHRRHSTRPLSPTKPPRLCGPRASPLREPVHQTHLPGRPSRHTRIMCRDDKRHPMLLAQLHQEIHHAIACVGIQIARRFIRQHQRR